LGNTDVRYANKHELCGKTLNCGWLFNNNPGVEDLWNSAPAWGFPFTASTFPRLPDLKALIGYWESRK
jgi:hypothetical protein